MGRGLKVNAKEIQNASTGGSDSSTGALSSCALWLKEIAYQLAVLNEESKKVKTVITCGASPYGE
jgi:hypothetical protein